MTFRREHKHANSHRKEGKVANYRESREKKKEEEGRSLHVRRLEREKFSSSLANFQAR